ncbi:Citrinin biosynthesis transcriptional activator [Lachnellula hyalina]|uniref:Citrinin biosynthesis transcriptional activator n=1 Tax=Lachnellula hyalina TaxID=1316788 RepID=A0A8H8TY81_9HELO|nr:Citrinin biosynthesis transcriptional activator [Lachnellula hyalina]TVY23666.1 Citrinin biosynthesis transcriptional activator [Lachnellula hyalina]
MVRVGGRAYVSRCQECRRRKVKCDGQQPACQRCIDTGSSCGGYERAVDYVHFDGTHSYRTKKLGKSENVSLRPKQAQKSPAERSVRNRAAALKRRDAPEQKLPIGIEANGIIAPWIDESFGVAQY